MVLIGESDLVAFFFQLISADCGHRTIKRKLFHCKNVDIQSFWIVCHLFSVEPPK